MLEKESGLRNILPVIRTLLDKEALFITEQIKRKYRPKTETYIKLAFRPEEQEKLRPIFEQLTPAKKQLKLLMAYLELSSFMQRGQFKEVSRNTLLERADVSSSVLSGLIDKGILISYKREISRLDTSGRSAEPAHALNTVQQKALDQILHSFKDKEVTLLHGVTSLGCKRGSNR